MDHFYYIISIIIMNADGLLNQSNIVRQIWLSVESLSNKQSDIRLYYFGGSDPSATLPPLMRQGATILNSYNSSLFT